MSQSATLIRVAKHALDGTAIYPHNGQNTFYYQPFDLSTTSSNSTPTPKYLAYTIQRPQEHLIPMASQNMRIILFVFHLLSIVIEKKKTHLTVFAPSSDPILSLSLCLSRICSV